MRSKVRPRPSVKDYPLSEVWSDLGEFFRKHTNVSSYHLLCQNLEDLSNNALGVGRIVMLEHGAIGHWGMPGSDHTHRGL